MRPIATDVDRHTFRGLSVCLCVGHTGNPCKTITIRSCAAAMRPRVRITLTTCFDYITRSSTVGSADLRKLCDNVISKLLCLTGPQSAVWPFRHGLTTFSATIFFNYYLPFKVIAQPALTPLRQHFGTSWPDHFSKADYDPGTLANATGLGPQGGLRK